MSDVTVISEGVIEVAVNSPAIVEVTVESQPAIEVTAYPGGITNIYSGNGFDIDVQLASNIILSHPSPYKEFIYDVDGNLIGIEYWDAPEKQNLLRETTLGYSLIGDLETKITTDIATGRTLTLTFVYQVGNLVNIVPVFTN